MTAPVVHPDPSAIAGAAGVFVHQLDTVQRRALFVRVEENELRAASFLDARLGMRDREGFWLPFEDLPDASEGSGMSPAIPAFIFHIGHCGSTLLSRLLDLSPAVLGLREPLVLRDLAAAELDRHSPQARLEPGQWDGLFVRLLGLLGRRFRSGQRVVVKATSNCNNLIAPLLSLFAETRIVLLHVALESYLATMLKTPGGGLDALHSAPARLLYLHRHLRDDSVRLYQLDPAETLALGWVAELARFHEIGSSAVGRTAAMALDFEALLGDPERHLAKVREHLRLPVDARQTAPVAQSPVLRAYAKNPAHAYSRADRDHDLALSRRTFAAEIARGMRWAEQMMKRHTVLAPLARLLR